MQIDSQLYGDGDDDELERNIALRAWPLKRLTDRRSVALTAQAQCLFFNAGEARLTCARKVVTKIADRRS
jgi:hypothetical protein